MKPLAVILLASILMLFACGTAPQSATDFSLPLSLTAKLKGSDAEFDLIIAENECAIDFSSNHPLNGVKLRFNSTGGQATVGGFTREVDLSVFPPQKALITAIRGLCNKDIPKAKSENQISYAIDKMSIIVYYDEDKRTVIGIETEESGRRFEFDVAQLEAYEIQSDSAG